MKQKLFTLFTLLLCFVGGAWATGETYTIAFDNTGTQTRSDGQTGNFFTQVGTSYNSAYACTYNGVEYKKPLKMEKDTEISFTSKVKSTVTIVMSTARSGEESNYPKFDGTALTKEQGVANTTDKNYVFTLTDVAAGKHSITRSNQAGLVFVSVVYTEEVQEATEVPAAPVFNPDNAISIKEGKTIIITSEDAESIKYKWTNSDATPASWDDYTDGVTVPLKSANTNYLHAYGVNAVGDGEETCKLYNIRAAETLTAISERTVWNISDYEVMSFADKDVINNLEFAGSTDIFASSQSSIDDMTFTKAFRSGGGGDTSKRFVHFKINGSYNISVYAVSGSTSKKDLKVKFGSANAVEKSMDAFGKYEFSYEGDDNNVDVYVYGAASILVYAIVAVPIVDNTKHSVTYDAGEGTGTMEGTTLRAGSTLTLPASTFTAPEGKGFAGWEYNGTTYDAGDEFTMPDNDVTFTAQYASLAGTAIIKATLTTNKAATVTGSIGGTADVSLSTSKDDNGGYKFGGKDQYIGLTLTGGSTFKTGDIINVHTTTTAQQGTIAIYDTDKSTILYDTETAGNGTSGKLEKMDNKFALPTVVNGKTTIYICRTQSNNWNGYVDYIEVTRPNSTITLNAYGFATYSAATDFEFVGAKAYKMALDEDAMTIAGTEVTGKIKAGEGILFKGETAAPVSITETTGAEALSGNSLKGSTLADGTTATKPTYCYALSGDTFKKYTGASLAPNKAYFETTKDLDTTAGARGFIITFDDGETTTIESLNVEHGTVNVDAPMYNLAGQKVSKSYKGIVIVNGKKYVNR